MSLAWTRAFPVVMTGHPSSTALLQYLNVGQALASTPDQLDDDAVGPMGRAAEWELDWGSTARQPSAVCGTAGCVAQESRGDLQTDRQRNRPVGGRPMALGYSRVWHRGPDIQVTEDRSQRRHPATGTRRSLLPPTLLNRYRQTEAPKKDHPRPMHPSEAGMIH